MGCWNWLGLDTDAETYRALVRPEISFCRNTIPEKGRWYYSHPNKSSWHSRAQNFTRKLVALWTFEQRDEDDIERKIIFIDTIIQEAIDRSFISDIHGVTGGWVGNKLLAESEFTYPNCYLDTFRGRIQLSRGRKEFIHIEISLHLMDNHIKHYEILGRNIDDFLNQI